MHACIYNNVRMHTYIEKTFFLGFSIHPTFSAKNRVLTCCFIGECRERVGSVYGYSVPYIPTLMGKVVGVVENCNEQGAKNFAIILLL